MKNFVKRASVTTLCAAALITLSGCGDTGNDAHAPGTPGTESIAALIAESDDLTTVETLMEEAGLAQTFDGMASYTVLAPTDAALATLGEEFAGEEARPALIAILREHVLPGYLTTQDIAEAIEANGGPVEMRTMGAGTLTFAMEGDIVTVSSADGASSAALSNEMLGANGVVLPVGTVLKDMPEQS